MDVLKWIAPILALGLDTLAMAVGLSLSGVQGRVKIALVFALAEAMMPALGLLLGRTALSWLGTYGPWAGAAAVIGVGIYLLFEDDDETEGLQKKARLTGLALLFAALLISVDELAVGLSFGLAGLPLGWTVLLFGLQALLFTWLGLTFGKRLQPLLGEAAEKLGGIVLILLGIWMIWELV